MREEEEEAKLIFCVDSYLQPVVTATTLIVPELERVSVVVFKLENVLNESAEL